MRGGSRVRILILSDIHENASALQQVIEKHPDIRTVLFLGDGLRHVEEAAVFYPDRRFLSVPGNCDMAVGRTVDAETVLEGKRLFFTHGHRYRVKYGSEALEAEARRRQADIVLFGHTHIPLERYEDGLYFFNPGSLGYGGTYGTADISPAGIMTSLLRL